MRKKITVVGAGNVGANCAMWIAGKELADVVLVDVVEGVPQGKGLDLLQAGPVNGYDVMITGANDYVPTADSDIVIITAGFPRKPGMSRDDLLKANYDVIKAVVEAVVKLSPNAGDIVSIAKAAEEAGADCLVIANTFLSLKIRTDNFRPALGNKFGGLVSPALKPIVLRMVYQVAKTVKIPIIGIGGVTKAEDVVEYMLAGASAVGIGYAAFRNPTALTTIIDDLEAWCNERGIKKVTELIGAVRDDDMEMDTLVAAASGP